MERKRRILAFFANFAAGLLVVLAAACVPVSVAQAGSPALSLTLGEATRGATRIPLVARLTDENGAPVAGARITFTIDGTRDGEARTDTTGTATWRVRRNLAPGTYQTEASWNQAPAVRDTYRLVVAAPLIDLQVPSAPRQIGQPVDLRARLTLPDGTPVVDVPVAFEVDGQREAAVKTGPDGVAQWTVRASLGTGQHIVKVVFDGRPPLLDASKEQSINLAPASLELRTVPPLPGATFTLDGRAFSAGDDGVARVTVNYAGAYSLTVASTGQEVSGVRREFATWGDGNTDATRTVDLPPGGRLDVGFNVFYLLIPRFTWNKGAAVEPARISSLTLSSSVGGKETVNPLQPLWLQGTYIAAAQQQLESRPISYVVDSVVVDGSNVVNQAQHRFQARPNGALDVQLFLFTAHFAARDAFFGHPIASAVQVTYPDGRTEEHPLDRGGETTVSAMARGLYHVKVKGSGLSISQPLLLSRDQDVPVKLISTLDLAVLFGSLALLALGLLIVGRRSAIVQWVRADGSAARQAAPGTQARLDTVPVPESVPVDGE